MRQLHWNLLTLSGMIISTTLGAIAQINIFIVVMGFCFGGCMIIMIHSLWGSERDHDRETKKLKEEGKYRKTVVCSNCGTSHYYTPSHGVCMLEFLVDKKCDNCKCSLKEQSKQQNPKGVNHE